jgi:LPS-assembly protein
MVDFCSSGYCVDYQNDGRIQSPDTLPPDNPQCSECDLQNERTGLSGVVEKKAPTTTPVIVYADRLFFDNKTGEAAADGSVIIEYDGKKMSADALFGNTQTGQGFVPGPIKILGDKMNINGQDLYIEGKTQGANVKVFAGTIGTSYFSGESVEIAKDKITLYNAIATGCPSNIPDYHISADRMEIFPNDRVVLYNAHVFLKNFELFSLQQMTINIGKKSGMGSPVPYPSVGYWSDTGFWINEEISVPLFVDNTYLDVNLGYYQKYGFAPNAAIEYSSSWLNTELYVGFDRDDQGHFIKKLPELTASTVPFKIGAAPVTLNFSGSGAVWQSPQQNLQSFHRTAQFYFQGDAINLPHSATLQLGAGGIGVWDGPVPDGIWSSSQLVNAQEAYNTSLLGDAVYSQPIASNLSYALEFHYQRSQTQIFDFNNPNASYAGVWGVNWQPTTKDNFSVRQTLDLASWKQTQLDTTWIRNWGCWNTIFVYHWATSIYEFNVTMVNW